MVKRPGALAVVCALTVVLASGCGTGSGVPDPGDSSPQDWCFASEWVDRASYVYAYWQEKHPHSPDEVKRAMGYGQSLMRQYQQDERSGDLPADLADDALKAWVVHLAHVQGDSSQNAAVALSEGGFVNSYLDQVHAAC
jgi:hypothetical protein